MIDVHLRRYSASFVRTPGPSRVHQDAPHHLRRHRKKLPARLPFHMGHVYQAQVNLMDDCGGLQGVALVFVLHIPPRHPAKFGIHVLHQLAQGCFVPASPGFQQMGDFDGTCVDG